MKYKVLIIDEIGYLSVDKSASHGFFQLIASRYESRSTILTTNQPLSKWGDVFGDYTIANAIIDRLVHHSSIIKITDFFTEMKKDVASKQQNVDKNENAPLCEEDGTKTIYHEEKIGDSYSKSEECMHYTFGTDKVWYQDYVNFYQCPECGEKIDEENITIEVDRECFGHN